MKSDYIEYMAEYTDTFGGEANYCWVQRKKFKGSPDLTSRQLLNRAKTALGLGSCHFREKYDCGDTLRYDEKGACRCLFITCVY